MTRLAETETWLAPAREDEAAAVAGPAPGSSPRWARNRS